MDSYIVCLLTVLLSGLAFGLPTSAPSAVSVVEVVVPSTSEQPPARSAPFTVGQCPTSLSPFCVCHDANARVYVVCVGLTLHELTELTLGEKDDRSAVWLRISDSRFPTLGPRAIKSLRIEGLQINSSNITQVHQHAFVDIGHLKSLALQDNYLTHIPVEALKRLPALEMVSLAGNVIESVPVNAFVDMPNLYYISLSQNRIRAIETGCFDSAVRQLALSSNQLTSLNNSVSYLHKLEWLLLTENRLSSLKGQLVHLQSLTHLHVGGNNLSDISDSFVHLNRLKALNLSQNAISGIGETDFDGLSTLSTLDLSRNAIGDVAENAFVHLRHLTSLHLSGNLLAKVEQFLEPLSRSLTRLFLSDNQLVSFDVTLPALRYLDLSRNRLSSIFNFDYTAVSKHFARLEQLILSGNRLERLQDNFRHLTPSLAYLHLDNNRFQQVDEALGGESGYWKRLTLLNLSGNAIENVSARTLFGLVTLSRLDLSRNRISRLELGCFDHLPLLQNVDLSHNRLVYLDFGLLNGLQAVEKLNLANNLLSNVNKMAFDRMTKLVHLDLSANRLINLRHFLTPLQALQTLNVSLNALAELDGADLADLRQLTALHVANNRLTTIGLPHQLNLPHLSHFNLNNNQLVSLDSLVLEQLPNLLQLDLTNNFLSHLNQNAFTRNLRLHRLQIQGNPWTCDTTFIDTLLGLEANGVQIDDKSWCINSILPTNLI